MGSLLQRYPVGRSLAVACCALLGMGAPPGLEAEELSGLERRETLRVGVAEFRADDVEARYRDLPGVLARIVAEDLGEIDQRRLSEAEVAAYRSELLRGALRSARETARRRRKERDNAFFATGTREQRKQRAEEAQERLIEAERELRRVEAYNPEDISVADEKPLELHGDGVLPPPRDPQRMLVRDDLDLLVTGQLEQMDRYLYLQLQGFARGVNEPVFATGFVAVAAELYDEVRAGLDHISGLVLGREWSGLQVVTDDPDARIEVDGQVIGYGSARERFLEPGRYTVLVSDESGERRREEVELEPGEVRQLSFVPDARKPRMSLVDTSPVSANLYLQSRWAGETPLALTLPERDQLGLIRREGYLDSRVVLGPRTGPRFQRTLQPDIEDQAARLRDSRRRFYRAFGYFVLSVPVTLVLNGVYENLSSAVPREGAPLPGLSSSERDRIAMQRETAYWATLGSLTVSVGLFVNMGVRLSQYIRTGEEAHYR